MGMVFTIVGNVIIRGVGGIIMAAETKQKMAVFTNALGEVNRGIVLAYDPEGLVKIRWERFEQMIDRLLGQRASSRDMLESSLGERTGWSRPGANRDNGSSLILVDAN